MKVKSTVTDTARGGPTTGADDPTTARVSSPAATGGAGTTFEQHVGAYWLAQLLVGAIPPILIDTTVSEVSFQTEHLRWQTDDLLVVCVPTGLPSRRLAGQVKRRFTVSAADEECAKAIGDFWKDFNGPNYSKENDRLVLVTQRGTNTLLEHFAGLLDCARASHDGVEFERRLSTEGFISDTAIRYCGELRKIIGSLEGEVVTAAHLWPFLRQLHVLSLDLFTATRQAEAQMKTLLAHTVKEGDPPAAAAASWNALVSEASAAMPEARTLRRADLPAALLERHSPIGTAEQKILRTLKEHTDFVLRTIRSTIGDKLHLERAALVQKVLDALEDVQIVLVAGPAGSGKSAIGKDAVAALSPAHFVFGFRVEEFAQPHLDATLHAAQVPANAATLLAILAAQSRRVILVESVERLLERMTRDAFSDLMALARGDGATRIILTCRDYSVDQVRASFLQPSRIKYGVVRVPPLEDAELTQVEAAHPPLAVPLKHPALRDILRNPFFLDKALEITWSSEKPVPQSEREFRALFWREIVRADHRVAAGMGRRREAALQDIAVRRARALSPHVTGNDLDPAAVDSLRRDSLIASPEGTFALVATAHDVLEDWAILQWLEEQHLTGAGSFKALSAAIGTHPAVRRSYRNWVAELVERDPAAADRLFHAAVTETDISVQFRDDTLVALLKSPSAAAFLTRHEAELLANNRAVLKRVIHLLRVACVTSPPWLEGVRGAQSILNVPDGPAWRAVLRLVHKNLPAVTPHERALLVALVEDAVRGVSWWAPDIEGAEFVAGIAHWLLDGMRGYSGEDLRKRVLEVIAKIPKADPARFAKTLRGHTEEGERRDYVADDFQELVFAGISGMPAARDLPDLIVSVGADYLLASEGELSAERRYTRGSSLDIDLYFGIKEGLRHESFPASGIRGPWGQLLRHHATKAIDFYIMVFNHSADWYAHPRLRDPLEPPWQVELTFADGSTRKHWLNGRLWGLYRSMAVGPYPLQSMLMALESWLLEIGKDRPELLDAILLDILRRSDNAALAAVAASAAVAYPQAAGETLLVLLSVRDYIVIDRSRMANERHAQGLSALVPTLRADHQIYEMERKQADALPHRQHDLEYAIAQLQLGPLAGRVHVLLDRHLAALPPKEEQDDDDLKWRLTIHRMDFRQYTVSDIPGPVIPATAEGDAEPQRYVRLDPKPPDADVQAMVDEGATRHSEINTRLGVFVWGLQAFKGDGRNYDPAQWSSKLAQAQAMDREADHGDGGRHGPGFVAAVCIRDHWDEMTPEQRDWCVEVVCSEVLRHADGADSMEIMQRNPMSADRAGAFVLASLLRKPLSEAQTRRVREAFVMAFTHRVDEVRWYATWSVDGTVWAEDRSLALRCVNAIAAEAAIIDKAREAEETRPYDDHRDTRDIMAEAAADIRARFWQDGAIADDAHATIDISDGFGADAVKRMLVILGRIPQDPLAIAAFTRAARTLVRWWTANDDDHRSSSRNFDAESGVSERLQEFLLRTSPEAARDILAPILAVIDRHSRELQTIMQGLTGIQDSNPNTAQYWFLWRLFADAVKGAKWIARLDDRHPQGNELLSAVFLTQYWKDDVRHWRFLEGYAHLVHAFFEGLPPASIVLDDYTRFLFHIGERSLPGAFVTIADALRRGDAQKMLQEWNTGFMLEAMLRRYVYGRPLALKHDARIRDAVLFMLDYLVETGSSAAFLMRDDFVTPAA
jgi:hypothetical protein